MPEKTIDKGLKGMKFKAKLRRFELKGVKENQQNRTLRRS